MDAYLIIGKRIDLSKYKFDNNLVIGIDKGAYLAYKAGIKLDYAVGDFDSISAQELEDLKNYTNIIKLNPIKDDTDTLHALRMFAKYDKLIVLGGITGKRIDHFVANLKLFYEFPNLVMVDDDTFISLCDKESYFHKDEYNFYSFFALEDVYDLSLDGFKYNLSNHTLLRNSSLGISNEIVLDKASLSYSLGKLLLIKTKNERKEL
jgi:thiamine pyrophosphokinase